MPPALVVAAFDVDGTLTLDDTLKHFLVQAIGRAKLALAVLLTLPTLIAWRLGRVAGGEAKERLLVRALAGCDQDTLQRLGERFAERCLPALLGPGMQLLQRHLAAGHRVVLVSGALDVYLKPWARAMGLPCLCTGLRFSASGTLQGYDHHGNCIGARKPERLGQWLERFDGRPEVYAYGNSTDDLPMLQWAQHSALLPHPSGKGMHAVRGMPWMLDAGEAA